MTELTRKYKSKLEMAIRRHEVREGYEQVKTQFGPKLAELEPEALDKIALMYRSLLIPRAEGMAKYTEELAKSKREAAA